MYASQGSTALATPPSSERKSPLKYFLFIILFIALVISVAFNFTKNDTKPPERTILEKELERLQEKIDEYEAEIPQLKSQFKGDSTLESLEAKDQVIEAKDKVILAKEESIKAKDATINQLELENKANLKTIEERQTQISTLQKDLNNSFLEINALKAEVKSVGHSREEFEKLKTESSESYQKLSLENTTLKTENEKLTKELKEIKDKIKIPELNERRENATINHLTEEKKVLQKQLEQTQKELNRFTDGLEQTGIAMTELKTKMSKLDISVDQESQKNMRKEEIDSVEKIIGDTLKVNNPQPSDSSASSPIAPAGSPLEGETRKRLIDHLRKLEKDYFTVEAARVDQITSNLKTVYNELAADPKQGNEFTLPFKDYFDNLIALKRQENEKVLQSIMDEYSQENFVENSTLTDFTKKMRVIKRDEALPKNPFRYERDIAFPDQITQYFVDTFERKLLNELLPREEILKAYHLALEVLKDFPYILDSDLLKFGRIFLEKSYLKFYEDPSAINLSELELVFARLKFTFPKGICQQDTALDFFCEHMEHMYLLGVYTNNHKFTFAVQNKLYLCPGSTILYDVEKTLEKHANIYATRSYIFKAKISDERWDYECIETFEPFFLEKTRLLYKNLTKKPFPDIYVKKSYTYESRFEFPNLPLPLETNLNESKLLFFGNPPVDNFLPFDTRNKIRLSLAPILPFSTRITGNHSFLLALLSDNPKFLSWYFNANFIVGSPILAFIELSDTFLRGIIAKQQDLNFFKAMQVALNAVFKLLSSEDQIASDMITPLLPAASQTFENLQEIYDYLNIFWKRLISLHNDTLLQFLPDSIRNIPFDQAGAQLTELTKVVYLAEPPAAGEPFANLLAHKSKCYNFLLLKCLYARAHPEMSYLDSDVYALQVMNAKPI
jgi:hypothetical protein